MANLHLFYEPFYEFKHFMEPSFGHPSVLHAATAPSSRAFKPKLDLHENNEKNLVTATCELPGVKKEDVELQVQNNLLTVSAENKTSSVHEESGYAIRERRYGKFSRSLKLPEGVKEGDINASMTDGVLTITFRKSLPEQEPKRIIIA